MRSFLKQAVVCLFSGVSVFIAACGGGGSSSTPPATRATYTLTVNSTTPATGVAIAVSALDNNNAGNGTTNFTRTYNSGTSLTLTAPATAGGNSFSAWSGCTTLDSTACTVTIASNTTVTADYVAPVIPTVTVTPSASSITTEQNLLVTVAVSGITGGAVPTGTIALSSGSYAATATALNSGTASITIPAGSLAAGTASLKATYTPDAASSTVYSAATGVGTVTIALITPTVTVTLASSSINSAQSLQVAVAVSGSTGGAVPTGSLALTSESYTSAAVPLSAGSATFTIPAGSLTAGTDALRVSYTPDAASSAIYNSAFGTNTVSVSDVTVTPSPASVTIGGTKQFVAAVTGTGGIDTVTWSLAAPTGSSLSPGTINAAGLYTTPYPAPATVTVTATSTVDTTKSGSAIVTIVAPAKTGGPALAIDAGKQTHAISPGIYGMNAYSLDNATAIDANITLTRWGGNNTSRYNYKLNVSNAAADYFFENGTGSGGIWPTGKFDDLVSTAAPLGIKIVGTANVLGWVAKDAASCSFPKSTYPDQFAFDTYKTCGDGEYVNQADIGGNDPTAASTQIVSPMWDGDWVTQEINTAGNAASNKGVAIWDLDNEPSEWDTVHRDVHPLPFTYDEVTKNGIAVANAIKVADTTAEVSGPVIDNWWNYFYSGEDTRLGSSSGIPCHQPWSEPVDRTAHNGIPLIEYYLQQFKTAETTYGKRLLDYVDIHTYFSATYGGKSVGLAAVGDTGAQLARMNSTRVFWDSTYTDPNFPQPNYSTDLNYTTNCNPPAQAPQVIPMMKTWVANDYPGTKTAIDEYNFGGLESINGAVTQADILGIFGREGLDLGALWPTAPYSQQGPGNMAFAVYRNYDGSKSTFGDMAVASTSADQSKLSVYGAVRTSDESVTIVVINKTFGDLTSTLSLGNIAASTTTAQAYLYSNADLKKIVAQPAVTVTPPAGAGTTSTLMSTFPAQSITLLVVPN